MKDPEYRAERHGLDLETRGKSKGRKEAGVRAALRVMGFGGAQDTGQRQKGCGPAE